MDSSFWGGFGKRAGERAHEENMLDIQNKVNMHKAFADHLQKITEDPSYTPEAQQKALERWTEAMRTGPMKFKNYDMSDILTVSNPRVSSVPGPPQSEGGAADYMHPTMYSPQQMPGEPPITRPGKWSPQEMSMMGAAENAEKFRQQYEATISYQERLKKASGTDPVDSRTNAIGSSLISNGITSNRDGQSIQPGGLYQRVVHRSGRSYVVGPIPEQMKTLNPMWDDDTNQWVTPTFKPMSGAIGTATNTNNLQPAPAGGTKQVWQPPSEAGGAWTMHQADVFGHDLGNIAGAPSSAYTGRTTSREEFKDVGGELVRQVLTTTSTPNNMPAAPTEPKWGTPGEPSTNPDVVTPASPAAAAKPAPARTAPPIPPPPKAPVARTSAAAINPPQPAQNPGDPNFRPQRQIGLMGSVGPAQKYDPRSPVLQKTLRQMTPNEMEKFRNNEAIYRKVMEMIKGVYDNSHILDSLLDSGRMTLLTSQKRGEQFISRVLIKPTKEEAKFGADFQGLLEHIQKMRGPLGAAGFRSLEAFQSLQAQKGSLLANPELTRNVLKNSLKTFLALQGTDRYMMARNDRKPNVADDETARLYLMAYGDPKTALTEMQNDGYTPEQ